MGKGDRSVGMSQRLAGKVGLCPGMLTVGYAASSIPRRRQRTSKWYEGRGAEGGQRRPARNRQCGH